MFFLVEVGYPYLTCSSVAEFPDSSDSTAVPRLHLSFTQRLHTAPGMRGSLTAEYEILDHAATEDQMQTCSYCGKENDDDAFNCLECATELEAGARVRNVREAQQAAVAEPRSSSGITRVVKGRAFIYLSLAVSIGALGYAAWVHQHPERIFDRW